ncbi:patatin-like phospholipase domain-containing protein 4 isoform X2 [Actinia tenebrosa]|uniref:Patatin-like phospholipase domain-containing protein 4 isoform X2 n=1 Tax=Actinia tenebrosa TaxID=6105 RepID=A0A6P8IIA3_ACTTE|nr:patatin-like phospholipase domain-containing protein 4 isoform X2 [Actinia tenebrosa]
MNLSFAGCGFLGVYHLGVAKCLVEHAPNFLRSIKAFAGASAGSLAAAMLATSAPIDKCSEYVVDLTNEARKNPLGPFSPQFDLVGNLRKGMEEYLPSNCHKLASGRLFISVTSLKTRKNLMISEYESKDELMKVLLASCYIPFYVGLDFPEFKGQRWFDGGFTDNLPIPPQGDTILVSPFSGNSHISPQDASKPLSEFYWRKMHVLVNKENAKRGLNVLYPPRIDGVDKLYSAGFNDAMRFLKTKGFIG